MVLVVLARVVRLIILTYINVSKIKRKKKKTYLGLNDTRHII